MRTAPPIAASLALAVAASQVWSQPPAPPDPPETARPVAAVTPEIRAEVVEQAASLLVKNYVFPEVARTMAALVRRNLDTGAYDAISDETALADRLTTDFRSVSNDKHLRVRAEPTVAQGQSDGPPNQPPTEFSPGGENFGFRKVEILTGNIGYVRFDGFAGGDDARAVASGAMAFVANTRAVIFDMRFNGGGTPDMVRFVCSYLFDQKTHLNDMFDRKGRKVEEFWTLEDVPGKRLGTSRPVYVLTSKRTFSGAEEFTYNLKCLKRATIVGETTGGGAHPVRRMRINDRFIIGVPYERACNPITGTNWEGTGVEPDVKCAAEEALERALEHAQAATARPAVAESNTPARAR